MLFGMHWFFLILIKRYEFLILSCSNRGDQIRFHVRNLKRVLWLEQKKIFAAGYI